MGWTRMEPSGGIREQFLQDMFCKWPNHGYLLAGTPSWLRDIRVLPRKFHNGRGYKWQADVELIASDDTPWIIELKHANEYEPLALAEVLHHAEMLSADLHRNVQPAIICRYNNWLRMSLWRLKRHHDASPIEYCEVQIFDDPAVTGRNIIWLDLPFAPRQATQHIPDILPPSLRDAGLHWYEVAETHSFIASRHVQDPSNPFLEGRVLQLTQAGDEHLLWIGEEAAHGIPTLSGLQQDYFSYAQNAQTNNDDLSRTIVRWLQ